MLKKSDAKKETQIVENLILSDSELKKQHELFLAEMTFKQKLIDARKAENVTQKEISEKTGLSQQAVSRLEKGGRGTIDTVIKYLGSMGYVLSVEKQ